MGRKRKNPTPAQLQIDTADLPRIASYATKKGYEVEIKNDHVVIRNDQHCIRTASMHSFRRFIGADS